MSDIRRVAVGLIPGQPLEPGICSAWAIPHRDFIKGNGLGPWFYKRLRQHPEYGLNSGIMSTFYQSYRLSVIQALQRQASIIEMLGAFSARGIRVLLLKGFYMGAVVYKDPALRPMVDTDILVHEEDFHRAHRELRSLGYLSSANVDWESELLCLPVMCAKPVSPIQYVDLHRCISAMDYYRLDSDTLWDNSTSSEIYGRMVSYLCPELNFIHLSVHTLNHRDLFRDWLDLAEFLTNVALDWKKLIGLARGMGTLRPLYWVFCELVQNWQASVPQWVTTELAAYSPNRLEDLVICHRTCYVWRLVSRLSLLSSWRMRFKYIRKKLLPVANSGTDPGLSSRYLYLKSKLELFSRYWYH